MSTATPTSAVLAAGAVCWRVTKTGAIEVLLISRGRHSDVSLPKGKVDPGETIPETAVREIAEETGYAVALGVPLGATEYTLPGGREKVVYYWAAEVTRQQLDAVKFSPNDEVDAIEWLPIAKAKKRLTYEHDGDVLDRFQEFVDRGALRTFAIIVLRHAKAGSDSTDGTDANRTLTTRGRQQAAEVARTAAAWGPQSIASSSARRCLDTVGPLAAALKLEVKHKASLSQDSWEDATPDYDAPARLARLVAKRIGRRQTTVLCTHSPVLPPLLDDIAAVVGGERDGRLTRAAILTTAAMTVVHLSVDDPTTGIVALETHSPLT